MPRKTNPQNPKLENSDLWVMLMSTIRYSMGRMTYMSSLCPELYRRYGGMLTDAQREQIAEEIERALELAEGAGVTLGMRMDHDAWKAFAASIRYELKNHGLCPRCGKADELVEATNYGRPTGRKHCRRCNLTLEPQ